MQTGEPQRAVRQVIKIRLRTASLAAGVAE
jgi:hypothetical protein